MPKFTYADLLAVEPHEFTAEASSLGWRPGQWPRVVETDMGNGQPFLLTSLTEQRATYLQANGCITVTVFND